MVRSVVTETWWNSSLRFPSRRSTPPPPVTPSPERSEWLLDKNAHFRKQPGSPVPPERSPAVDPGLSRQCRFMMKWKSCYSRIRGTANEYDDFWLFPSPCPSPSGKGNLLCSRLGNQPTITDCLFPRSISVKFFSSTGVNIMPRDRFLLTLLVLTFFSFGCNQQGTT